LNIKTTSGDIQIGVAEGTSVWMDVSSLSGDTNSYLAPGDGGGGATLEVRASSLSGDITLRSTSAALR
ncbi:MAG: hypothetical protein QOH90_164, partial [Actinomycetota bacterium]|nr:hypothetical protein [Actinomycetota bacterium]